MSRDQIAENQFESKSVAEKEGFEPSINDNPLPDRPGTQPRDFDLHQDLKPKPRQPR